jgi:hypothetical protein
VFCRGNLAALRLRAGCSRHQPSQHGDRANLYDETNGIIILQRRLIFCEFRNILSFVWISFMRSFAKRTEWISIEVLFVCPSVRLSVHPPALFVSGWISIKYGIYCLH